MHWIHQYIREDLRRSFGLWKRSEAATASIILIISAILGGASAFGASTAVASVQNTIYIGLAVGFGFLLLIVTPARMWKDSQNTIERMEGERASRLSVELVKEEEGGIPGSSGWGLIVRNCGTIKADGCSARIEEFAFQIPSPNFTLNRWPTDRPLHWAGQESGSYEIPGGQSAHLSVISSQHNPDNQSRIATIAYRGDIEFRKSHALPNGHGPVLLLINLVCNEAIPQYIVCRILPELVVSTVVRGYSDDVALSVLCVTEARPSLSDFQQATAQATISEVADSQKL